MHLNLRSDPLHHSALRTDCLESAVEIRHHQNSTDENDIHRVLGRRFPRNIPLYNVLFSVQKNYAVLLHFNCFILYNT